MRVDCCVVFDCIGTGHAAATRAARQQSAGAPGDGARRYRAAAAGGLFKGEAHIVFTGGADRPYNYNGQGYDGELARALRSVVSYNLDAGRWECHAAMPKASMDHRGLIIVGKELVLIGGMNAERQPTARVVGFELSPPLPCSGVERGGVGL